MMITSGDHLRALRRTTGLVVGSSALGVYSGRFGGDVHRHIVQI